MTQRIEPVGARPLGVHRVEPTVLAPAEREEERERRERERERRQRTRREPAPQPEEGSRLDVRA